MKKASIPVLMSQSLELNRFCAAVKQNLDDITGQSRNIEKISALPATASNAEIIAKINEIIERMQ
jgi:hypothetical protein